MRPTTRVEVDEATAGKLMRLIEQLEDDDDVAAVHANFDADAEVLGARTPPREFLSR